NHLIQTIDNLGSLVEPHPNPDERAYGQKTQLWPRAEQIVRVDRDHDERRGEYRIETRTTPTGPRREHKKNPSYSPAPTSSPTPASSCEHEPSADRPVRVRQNRTPPDSTAAKFGPVDQRRASGRLDARQADVLRPTVGMYRSPGATGSCREFG